jgi:antitoxin ParD1/3/4
MDSIKPKGLLEKTPLESWLHEQVAPAYDRLKADPSRALSVDDVKTALVAEYQQAQLR